MPVISRNLRMWMLVAGLAVFAWLTHGAYRALSQQKEEQSSAAAHPLAKGGKILEDFSLEALQGKPTNLNSLRGKVVLINFWAGWCAPCIHEMPGLYELQKRFQAKGFEVLAVNMDDNPEDGIKVLRRQVGEPPFPIYKGNNSDLADRFRLEGLPFTVIVDRGMEIRYAEAGDADWKSAEAIGMIEGLL